MADEEHLEWLRKGIDFWNDMRQQRRFAPDFSGVSLRAQLAGSSCVERDGDSVFIRLDNANLEGGDFRNADLGYIHLKEANLRDARFRGTLLQYTDFTGAEIANANFRDANLRYAKLNGTYAQNSDFTGASLFSADLRDACLAYANLTRAYLGYANLSGTNFFLANLTGADISYTQPLASVLYPGADVGECQASGFPEKVTTVGDVINICRFFENYYGTNSQEGHFRDGHMFYFRGESDISWKLSPSIMRNPEKGKEPFQEKEGKMLLDLMSRRPQDFASATSALSQWVIAQQHGLRTRLLDITRNPLMALFHTCEDSSSSEKSNQMDGALHVFVVPENRNIVKSFDSDAVSVVANLAKLPLFEQHALMGKFSDYEEAAGRVLRGRSNRYPDIMDRLYHHIRQEKPYFKERIDVRDLFRVFVVEPRQSFERIKVQSGAFLVSAFHERFEKENILASNGNIPVYDHYKLVVPAGSKKDILSELRFLNVTREVLFPGLDEAAAAIVKRNNYANY